MWLDSLTGQILQVKINKVGRKPALFRLPTTQEAERQLSASLERYHGIPIVLPQISLEGILKIFKKEIIYSEVITIQYLIYSGSTTDIIPAWIITMRGGALATFASANVPIYNRVTRRIVVNALTGIGFGVTNTPFPEINKDSIK